MSVLQRVTKPSTHKGKKILLRKEPQLHEGPKRALFFKGRKTSDKVRNVLKDIYHIKKPEGQMLSQNHDITIFEDQTPVENFCRKYETHLFMMGSHTKKRPDNLVIGRMYNYSLLDMIELNVEGYDGLKEFANSKISLGTKPCLLFNGPQWEQTEEMKHLKSIFIDLFHREYVSTVRLQGIEHTISFNVTADGKIGFRSYRILLKKSGTKVPRVELEEIGPRIDFTLRRSKLPSEDLMKEACRKPKEASKAAKKNISTDNLGTTHGRIHIGKQNIQKIQTRKMKGLKKTLEVKKQERGVKRKAVRESNNNLKKQKQA